MHRVRFLAESKLPLRNITDALTGQRIFWWRGSDVRFEIAVTDNGQHLLAGDIGTLIVEVKNLTAGPADDAVMRKEFGTEDCDATFTAADWNGGVKALLFADFTDAEAALAPGHYRIIVRHEDPAGLKNTYCSSEIEVIEDHSESSSLSAPPSPGSEYWNKTEADTRYARTSDLADAEADIAAVEADVATLDGELTALSAEVDGLQALSPIFPVNERKDYLLILYTGQSLGAGNQGGPEFTSVPLDSSSFMFAGGLKSRLANMTSLVPLIEDILPSTFPAAGGFVASNDNSGETGGAIAAHRYHTTLRDEFGIAPTAFPSVIVANVARGGYSLPNLQKGHASLTYDVLEDAIEKAEDLATAAGKTSQLLGIVFRQGESGNSSPTQTAVQYADMLQAYKAQIQADATTQMGGAQKAVLISYQTSSGIIGAGKSPNASLGQALALRRDPQITISTPMYPIYAAGYLNAGDLVHSSNFGYALLGEYEGRALARLAHGNAKPWPVSILTATARGQVIDVKYRVPTPPLAFDTTAVPAVTNNGFLIKDDTGTLTIHSMEITGGDTVRILVNRVLGNNPLVRYALDADFTGSTVSAGAAGNLRDSHATIATIAGRPHTLRNWAIHDEFPITKRNGITRRYILNTSSASYADEMENFDATVIGTAPTFASTHAVLSTAASLETNIAPGAELTCIVVWQFDTSKDTVLIGNFGTNLAAANGASLFISGASGILRLYRKNVTSAPAAPQVVIPSARNGQWCVAAFAVKATEATVYSPQSLTGIGRSVGTGFTIDASPTVAIGGARYTQSHAGTANIAAAVISNACLSANEIDAQIAILRTKLSPLGITI